MAAASAATMKFAIATVVVLIASVAAASGSPLSSSDLRISNGYEVVSGEFPCVVSVTLYDEHICGGFIYSPEYVITAASCVKGQNPYDMAVIVAQISLIQPDPNETRLQSISFNIHPEYDEKLRINDIAFVKISPLVMYGPNVDFCYYEAHNDTQNSATVVGWGAVNDGGPPSIKLRKADVTLDDVLDSNCRLYGLEEYDFNTMICAGNSEIDDSSPCNYDQGSPLIQDGFVIGIMSKNQGCDGYFAPTIYTRLSAFYVWIKNVAGQQPIPSVSYN